MQNQKEKSKFSTTTVLIALCWVVYTCSYLGKLGYNANITSRRSPLSGHGALFYLPSSVPAHKFPGQ